MNGGRRLRLVVLLRVRKRVAVLTAAWFALDATVFGKIALVRPASVKSCPGGTCLDPICIGCSVLEHFGFLATMQGGDVIKTELEIKSCRVVEVMKCSLWHLLACGLKNLLHWMSG